jgi:allantoin racemase
VFRPVARYDCEVSHVFIDNGPASIECEFDEALAVPDTVAKIVEAEADGVDAVVVNCMGDPGVKAAREAVRIPVLGPCEASMHLAGMLAHRFSIVTILESIVPLMENLVRVCGLESKLASIRWVDVPVLELEETPEEELVSRLVEESIGAVEEDGANLIFFGCTGMTGLGSGVRDALRARGYVDVPVIDPAVAAFKIAEAVVDLGLTQSLRTYPRSPEKEIVGYPRGGFRATAAGP